MVSSDKPKFLIQFFEGTSVDYAKWIEDTEKENSGYTFHSNTCVSALRNDCGKWSTTFVYNEAKSRQDELDRREKTGRWRLIMTSLGEYLTWTTLPVDRWREFPRGVEGDISEDGWPEGRPKPPIDINQALKELDLYTF